MVHSIVYDAVEKKVTLFQQATPLINMNELVAAISMGYRQAGLPHPDLSEGQTADEIRNAFLAKVEENEKVNPKIFIAIKNYPEGQHTVNQDALDTYEYGKNL